MNKNETVQEGQRIMADIIKKCWEDESFKNEFKNNPVKTIEEFTGKEFKLEDNKVFKVVDQTDEDVVYFNIPKKVDPNNVELTEEQLEKVAGGVIGIDDVLAGIAAAAIYDYGSGFIKGLFDL